VIDTVAFDPDLSGVARNVPSSAGKHMVERLTLTADRTRLRYEVTVTDPGYLSAPATLTQQWNHRPDLEFAAGSQPCDDDVAARYREQRIRIRPATTGRPSQDPVLRVLARSGLLMPCD
jgi:hypothetical protein